MAGGQGGLSFLGEDKVFTVGATAGIILVTQLWWGCIGWPGSNGGGGEAMTKYDQRCEQEYADANDGDPETEVETAILEQPDCRAHLEAMQAERQREQTETIQGEP